MTYVAYFSRGVPPNISGGTDRMTSSELPDPNQMALAASICGKYCSKTAALTNWITENEPRQCDTCLHWNHKPCSKMGSLVNQTAEVEL